MSAVGVSAGLPGNPDKRSRTSAVAPGLRASLPLKMTSSIFSPRRLFALCSPSTQVMASATLLLPQPLGPTMAVTPSSKASSDRSENDLKPEISRRSRPIPAPCPYEEIDHDTHGPALEQAPDRTSRIPLCRLPY